MGVFCCLKRLDSYYQPMVIGQPKGVFFFERFVYLGSTPTPNPVTQQMKGFRLGFFIDSLLKLSEIILNPGDDCILGG